ncbi:CMP-N,N'-diacetyllegionaminic acid synthase [subsurface metagenome]
MIVAVIPAKGESSRFPNKNMHLLANKPMTYYSIKVAKESRLIEEIYVSTDSDEVAKYAEEQGAKVIRRGPDLGGETPVVEVYYHALQNLSNK